MDQKVPERSEGPPLFRSPGEAWELELLVGLVPDTEHWQAMVTVRDARSGAQLLNRSTHHQNRERLAQFLYEALSDGWRLLSELAEPF